MAITRLGGANAITGTLPAANINDTSIGNITALPAGVGGKVLQVVTGTYTAFTNTTSTSFVATPLSVSITPSSSSNKVFVTTTFGAGAESPYSSGGPFWSIFRGSTNLGNSSTGFQSLYANVAGNTGGAGSMQILDNPSTTSATTYAVYFRTQSASYETRIGGQYAGNGDGMCTITAMEISA